jgi:hypothetical protein
MKKFLYFLTKADGKSYYLENGVVKTRATPTPLSKTPEGWEGVSIGWERSIAKGGIVRSFSVPLSFVGSALNIIKNLVFTKSLQESICILITRLSLEIDFVNYSFTYNLIYKGELDLSTAVIEETKASCSIMEGGLSKLLKSNENTVYQIPLDDPDRIWVKMDGLYLSEKHNFDTGEDGTVFDHIVPTLFINKEGQAFGVATFTVYMVNSPSISPTSEDYFLLTSQAISGMTLSGSFNLMAASLIPTNYNLRLKSSTGQDISIATFAVTNTEVNYAWSVTFNSAVNERFWLYADLATTVIPYFYFGGSFSLSYKSKAPQTIISAFKPDTLLKRLGSGVFNKDVTRSQLLDLNPGKVLTCGDAIRGIEGAQIKTSLNQFYEDCRVRYLAGQGIEGDEFTIEPLSYYLTIANPVRLGEAKDLKVSYAKDLLCNTVKVGYGTIQTDDVNGKYAFNNSLLFSSEQKLDAPKELTLISPYYADPYAIELVRINLEGKTTTDNSSDNQVFILDIDYDNPETIDGLTVYPLFRPTQTITGVPDTTDVFNIGLSPKRILETWIIYINSIFYKLEGTKLKFETTEKNADLKTIRGGVTVEEKADVIIGTDKLFLPFYFEYDSEAPTDLPDIMEADPNRSFITTWNDSEFEGFSIKVGISPTDNKAQSFKTLATPGTNLLLI